MAGLGDKGKGVARRRRDGLATDVASQLEAEAAGTGNAPDRSSESPVAPPVAVPPISPTKTPGLTRKASVREKGSWYVSVELADSLRDACEYLNNRDYELNGAKVSVGALVEPPIQTFLQSLWDEHNDGQPFPTSLATKTSRTRRKKR